MTSKRRTKARTGAKLAENSTAEPARGRGPGRPFQKGRSPNPGGRPKAVRELLDLARKEVPASFELAVRLRDDENGEPRVRLEAAKFITAYGLGAPPKVALEDDDAGDESANPFEKFTDAQVAELASRKLSTEH